MKFFESIRLGTVVLALTLFGSCQESEDLLLQNEENPMLISGQNDFESKHKGFVHGIVIPVDGEDYYFDGPPDGPGGATDIPGHTWVQAGPNQLVGKHYNTGPFGSPNWWSSDAMDGEYLYKVHLIIDTWSYEKAEMYASRGYVYYHESIKVSDRTLHPTKVPWLKHTARIYT